MSSRRCHCWMLVIVAAAAVCDVFASSSELPIYIEDSHAGSFYFLAKHLDLDRPHTFLLFDAHSDASSIFNSDAIRAAIRSSDGSPTKKDLFRSWRESGKIQCYNWIEPLMPSPFAQVIWIPPKDLDPAQIFHLENECRLFLDGHEEVCPRTERNLSRSYRVTDLARLKTQLSTLDKPEQPIVVSIDLDFFASMPDAELEPRFKEIFLLVLSIKNLAALTFSVSTPYLRDAEQVDRLLALAVKYSCRVANADVEFEPFAPTGPDTSVRANQLKNAGLPLPKLGLDQLSESTRNCLINRADRLKVTEEPDRWRQFLTGRIPETPEIRVSNRGISAALMVKQSELSSLRLVAVLPPETKVVRWYSLRSAADSYSISDEPFGFADGAPRWIYQEPLPLSDASTLQGPALLGAFDSKTGYGVANLFVESQTSTGNFDSKIVRVISVADGVPPFQQTLSSEFNLPYIFFGSSLALPGATGPEVGLGTDCANFIIYGLRENGWQIPWSDAKHLIPKLCLLAKVDLDQPSLDADHLAPLQANQVSDGIIVVFDNHVAALWHANLAGWLGLNDLVVHQLEGRPEIVPLASLAKTRRHFSVLTVPQPEEAMRVVIGGDVMLGRTNGQKALVGSDLFLPWSKEIGQADLAFANLECSVCASNLPPASKPYCFRAPLEAVTLLAKASFRGMLVANNHTGDFGLPGFKQTVSALRRAGVIPIGGGAEIGSAATAARFERKGVRLAVFGCADPSFCSPVATATEAGICPWDSGLLLDKIGQAAKAGEVAIVFCHWDAESNLALCRERATEWIDAGAAIIIGSGPHHVLGREMIRGHPVFYSVGNLLFDGGGPDQAWSRGAMVALTIAYPDSLVRAQIIDPQ
jgi:poly-gamma-glutamate capsule biosynthesis protein CapA/YwtB (metallophosphatase superfamily)